MDEPDIAPDSLTFEFGDVCFPELREHKRWLIDHIQDPDPRARAAVEGLLSLIDSMQDYAVDEQGIDPGYVYDTEGDGE